MNIKSILFQLAGWLFGILLLAIGFVNTFWGNDPLLGIGIFALSFIYFPPINRWIHESWGITIPVFVKILLGLLLLWICLGVGELFHKIDLMLQQADI